MIFIATVILEVPDGTTEAQVSGYLYHDESPLHPVGGQVNTLDLTVTDLDAVKEATS